MRFSQRPMKTFLPSSDTRQSLPRAQSLFQVNFQHELIQRASRLSSTTLSGKIGLLLRPLEATSALVHVSANSRASVLVPVQFTARSKALLTHILNAGLQQKVER